MKRDVSKSGLCVLACVFSCAVCSGTTEEASTSCQLHIDQCSTTVRIADQQLPVYPTPVYYLVEDRRPRRKGGRSSGSDLVIIVCSILAAFIALFHMLRTYMRVAIENEQKKFEERLRRQIKELLIKHRKWDHNK